MIQVASTPWLHPAAIAAIEAILEPDWEVLETGAGGSTIWFAERVARVVTFEHDAVWYETVWAELERRHLSNVQLRLDPGYIRQGIPDFGKFDLVMIDGRGRVKSCETAQVRPGGYLVLDNSERERYRPAIELLDSRGWERTDHWHVLRQWQTTIWRAS